jgi:hypothetical protein
VAFKSQYYGQLDNDSLTLVYNVAGPYRTNRSCSVQSTARSPIPYLYNILVSSGTAIKFVRRSFHVPAMRFVNRHDVRLLKGHRLEQSAIPPN